MTTKIAIGDHGGEAFGQGGRRQSRSWFVWKSYPVCTGPIGGFIIR